MRPHGPGAKPGEGFALSHCGEYWLRVANSEVIGSIDVKQSLVKRMALDEFKRKFLYRFGEMFMPHSISVIVNTTGFFPRPSRIILFELSQLKFPSAFLKKSFSSFL